jgi:hypothetical protein
MTPGNAVSVSVTPLTGDPDLYMCFTNTTILSTDTDPQLCMKRMMANATNYVQRRPTKDCYFWKSMAYGPDFILVSPSDPNYGIGSYTIAVYAFSNSTFTLTAENVDLSSASSSSTSMLVNGVPLLGYLAVQNTARFYDFVLSPLDNSMPEVTFTVTPRYGDPDMYIINYLGDGATPSPGNSTWVSAGWGRDRITIRPSDPNFCNAQQLARNRCFFRIGVFSYSAMSLFTLTATTESSTTVLQNGVPTFGAVNTGAYRYYAIMANNWFEDLTIVVTTTSDSFGDPDLYVAPEIFGRPNSTNCYLSSNCLSSTTFGDDQIYITSSNLIQGLYYISVYGWRNTSFALTATNGPITLLAGEPQRSIASASRSVFFVFFMPYSEFRNETLEFTLSLSDPSIQGVGFFVQNSDYCQNKSYVSFCYDSSGVCCEKPDADHNQWSNQQAEASIRNQIRIVPADMKGPCFDCYYYIGIQAPVYHSVDFTLTVQEANSAVTLRNGRPVTYSVVPSSYKFFKLLVTSTLVDLNVDVTLLTGFVTIFVSNTNGVVSASSFNNATDFRSYSSPHVTILNTQLSVGWYYINVYGDSASTFSLVASTQVINIIIAIML